MKWLDNETETLKFLASEGYEDVQPLTEELWKVKETGDWGVFEVKTRILVVQCEFLKIHVVGEKKDHLWLRRKDFEPMSVFKVSDLLTHRPKEPDTN
jgi:hypothetical protein